MNKIILMGNLTRDPEGAKTGDGTYYSTFSIAVSREYGDESSDFFNCTVFGKMGENFTKYVKKGQKVLLEGRVKQSKKTNDEGITKVFWNVIVSHWEFAGRSMETDFEEDQPERQTSQKSSKGKTRSEGEALPPADDEDNLPF